MLRRRTSPYPARCQSRLSGTVRSLKSPSEYLYTTPIPGHNQNQKSLSFGTVKNGGVNTPESSAATEK
jgi:hypothetical protein